MEIRTLCDSKIRDYGEAKGIPIAYENEEFKGSGIYLEPFLLPALNSLATFQKEKESGVYQVNIYVPINDGSNQADELAQEIMSLFKTGSKTGDFIHLPATSRSSGFKAGAQYYCVTILVNYMRIK